VKTPGSEISRLGLTRTYPDWGSGGGAEDGKKERAGDAHFSPRLATIGLDFFVFAGLFNQGRRMNERNTGTRGRAARAPSLHEPGGAVLGQVVACHGIDYSKLWF